MPRYKLTVEYDGTGLVGWQRQDEHLSVQEIMEVAAQKFCGETVTAYAAGRTDAGVHARGQVVHMDLPHSYPLDSVMGGLNFHMKPRGVAVVAAEEVDEDFHARFSAAERAYQYVIINRRGRLTLDQNRAWHVPRPLQLRPMQDAASLLIGTHDLTTFRATACQAKSPVRSITSIELAQSGECITLDIAAPSFLHHQVRNIVGSLKLVGEGKWQVDDFAAALAARDRTRGGPTAPAHGLYMTYVKYG